MKHSIILFVLFIFSSCCKSTDEQLADCGGKKVILSASVFNDLKKEYLNLSKATITDNCLSLTIGFSGCDNNHTMDLIGDGGIGKSLPIVTNLKIRDNNSQLCDAYFTKEFTFDLTPYKSIIGVEKKVRLVLGDSDLEMLWEVK